MEREQQKYLRKINQTRSEASKMQEVRDAKQRAFEKLNEAKQEKEEQEQNVRGRIENKREYL